MKNKKGMGFLGIFLIVVLLIGTGFVAYKIATKDKPVDVVFQDNTGEVEEKEYVYVPLEDITDTLEPEVCVSEWVCGKWSICKNGLSTIECNDTNNCAIPTNVPELTKKCKSSSSSSTPAPVIVVEPDVYGELILTKKDLVTWIPTGDNLTINYTSFSSVFNYSVINGTILEGYVLVYYPNRVDYSYWDGFVVVSENITMNLPMEDDLNSNESLSDYCTNGFNPDAVNCIGAKLWLVPETDLVYGENETTLTWANPNEYYFETDLITYTKK